MKTDATRELIERYNRWGLIGRSESMVKLFRQLEPAIQSDCNVRLYGQPSFEMTLIARLIHEHGLRSAGLLVYVNCAGLPEWLGEAELFGIEKDISLHGSERRAGKLELANGGVFVLKNAEELSDEMQRKLLKALENKCVLPAGASYPVDIDVRVISVSVDDVDTSIRIGSLRADLHSLLAGMEIGLPPLKERLDDLPLLVQHFIDEERAGGARATGMTPEALDHLRQVEWIGGVMKLRHLIIRAALETDGLVTLDALKRLLSSFDRPE